MHVFSDIKELGDFKVVVMDELREKHPERFNESGAMNYAWFEKDIRPTNFVYVRQDVNSISFTLQKGPRKEVGTNGCDVDTLIEAAKMILYGFQSEISCKENEKAIKKLDEALALLEKRKKDRERRGVAGTGNQ